MSDLYLKLVNTPVGKTAAQSLGLPSPAPLKRLKRVDQPFVEGNVLIGAGNGARAVTTLGTIIGTSRPPCTVLPGRKLWPNRPAQASKRGLWMSPMM